MIKHLITILLSTRTTKIILFLSHNPLGNLFPLLQIALHSLSSLKLLSVRQKLPLRLKKIRSISMFLFFMVTEMIERSGKDDDYILSPNSARVQYYTLVNKIRSITSETIARIQLVRLSKLKQIPYLLIYILLFLR